MARLCDIAVAALKAVGACLLWAVVLTVALQVASRYLLNDSFAWTEEGARLALVWLAFIGAGTASFLGMHLRLDLVESIVRTRATTVLVRLVAAAATLTVLIVLVNGNRELIDIRRGIPFTTFPLSSSWLAYAVTVGGVLMAAGLAIRLVLDLRVGNAGEPPATGGS